MPKDCVVLLDGVTTVPIAGLRSLITRLTNARMDDVCRALTFALGCS
jgi:mRNA-degrading endonuclease toxin of MazEF toxin-antitoxin module